MFDLHSTKSFYLLSDKNFCLRKVALLIRRFINKKTPKSILLWDFFLDEFLFPIN